MNGLHTTDDPRLAELAQESLEAAAFYSGAIDGQWGPKSELAFQQFCAHERYKAAPMIALTPSADQQADLAKFLKLWKSGAHAYYATVERATNLPAELVAALHWRESGGDFTTYLQNGDPLGAPTVHEPYGLLFTSWTTAAIDAITREKAAWQMSGIEAGEHKLAALCVFAEYFNGEGYAERNVPDPYVLAGTAGYVSGKYASDGVFAAPLVDQQIGVLPLLRAILI